VAIRYSVAVQRGAVTLDLSVYDVRGRLVRVLHRGRSDPGEHVFLWDRRHDNGDSVGRGIYFVRLHAATTGDTRKIAVR